MRHRSISTGLLAGAALSLLAVLLSGGRGAAVEAQTSILPARRIIGVATAVVLDIQDPERQGRIKVKFPWLAGVEDAGVWARVALPLGGNQTGLWALPEVGDEVLVAFEHGDLRHPYVLGSLWNGQERPPDSKE